MPNLRTKNRLIREILLACFFLALVSLFLTIVIAPDSIDPLRYVATIDSKVLKTVEEGGERFVIVRVKPGKIFMVRSDYASVGDSIEVDHYRRLLTRREVYKRSN